jgi:hypothetical protein
VGKRVETVTGFSVIKKNGNPELSPNDIYTLIILFGEEKLMKDVVEKYFVDHLTKVFGKEYLTRVFVSFDWKALKNMLAFLGDCPWCSQSKNCKAETHGAENRNCKCDKNFSNIGCCEHQTILNEKIKGKKK